MIRSQAQDEASSLQSRITGELDQIRTLKSRLSVRLNTGLLRRADLALMSADCPSCGEAQPDGIPCPSPSSVCDACIKSLEHLRALRLEMEAACGDPGQI